MYVDFLRMCVEYWRGLHVDLHPTHSICRRQRTALVCCNARDAVVAEEGHSRGVHGCLGRQAGKVGWQAGWGGGPGRVVGRVGWRDRWSGGPGQVLAWRGGLPGGMVGRVVQRGWIIGVKNVLE